MSYEALQLVLVTDGGTDADVVGMAGEAMRFSGAGRVAVPYDDALGLNEFTVSAWVNMSSKGDNPPAGILGTRIDGEHTFDVKVMDTIIHGDVGDGTGWISISVDIGAGDVGSTGQGGNLVIGQWHMVTYVVDESQKQFEL